VPESLELLGLALLGVVAGASFVMQQAVNAHLRSSLGSPWWAAFISYLGGTLTMSAVLLVMREPWFSLTAMARSSWWAWTGGFFGTVYIVIAILLLPRLGAATVVALIVAGQMLTSLAFDYYGAFGVPQHPADLPRLLGALFLIAGVVLVRL
jgi:bacterial/archaeal transporter family-2 protein